MIPIDTIVSIKSGDEYGGKYTGKLGIIKKFTDDRVGVEFAGLKNHASKYGLFWFKKENVTPSLFDAPKRNDAIIPAALAKAFLNFTFGAPRASLGVKQVISVVLKLSCSGSTEPRLSFLVARVTTMIPMLGSVLLLRSESLAPLLRQRRSWHGRGRRLPNEHNLYRRTAKWQNNHAHRNV